MKANHSLRESIRISCVRLIALTISLLWFNPIIVLGTFAQGTFETLVLPQGSATVEGNTSVDYPFRSPNGRLQQFYDASGFSSVTPALDILSIAFRVEGDNTLFGSLNESFGRVTITLSTTTRGAGQISDHFSQNTGPDATVVFDGPITFNASQSQGPAPFAVKIPFQNGYIYDPNKGNLIMEISHNRDTFGNGRLDGQTSSWPAVGGGALDQGIKSDVTIVTEFGYTVVPEPATITLCVLFGSLVLYAHRQLKRR
jgi:hypothetical protein